MNGVQARRPAAHVDRDHAIGTEVGGARWESTRRELEQAALADDPPSDEGHPVDAEPVTAQLESEIELVEPVAALGCPRDTPPEVAETEQAEQVALDLEPETVPAAPAVVEDEQANDNAASSTFPDEIPAVNGVQARRPAAHVARDHAIGTEVEGARWESTRRELEEAALADDPPSDESHPVDAEPETAQLESEIELVEPVVALRVPDTPPEVAETEQAEQVVDMEPETVTTAPAVVEDEQANEEPWWYSASQHKRIVVVLDQETEVVKRIDTYNGFDRS